MPDEKDRLREQLRRKEHADEDKYFAELSKKQIERLHKAHAAATATSMKCPRCGADLEELHRHGAAADACPKGCGMWLDQGEIDLITQREGEGWLARLVVGREGDKDFPALSKEQNERLHQAHANAKTSSMHCPRCGGDLAVVQRHGAAADACPKGCGVWLDRGEIERIRAREGEGWLAWLLLGLKR